MLDKKKVRQSQKHRIELTIRVRPPSKDNESKLIHVEPETGQVSVEKRTFNYANFVVGGSDQLISYRAIASNLIPKIKQGFSCAVMAYGETGSGKTYTTFGPPGAISETSLENAHQSVPAEWGVFPRAVVDLLKISNVTLQASAVEIYQNEPYDLMNNRKKLPMEGTTRKRGPSTVRMHDHTCGCDKCNRLKKENEDFATRGTTRVDFQTPKDIAHFCQQIELTRTAKSHLLNDRSSRSHCLVQVHLRIPTGDNAALQPTFLFVDLAGSERIRKSGVSGVASTEARGINSSLTTLGRVIQLIGKKETYIPYRDSTLTMLLKPLFGGSSCTSVVVNVSSETAHEDETLGSLRFGQRMTLVKNVATVVEGMDLTQEKEQLEKKLMEAKEVLQELERMGKGGKFGPNAVSSEKKTFLENLDKMKKAQKAMRWTQVQLAEAKAKDSDAETIHPLESQLKKNTFAFNNIRDVIIREKMIRGFWIEPSATYTKNADLVLDLEMRLRMF